MIRTGEYRTSLKNFVNKKVHVIARVSDFATVRSSLNSIERRPSILLRDLEIIKGKSRIYLNHMWIVPKGSILRNNLKYDMRIGDIVEFDAIVIPYKKFHRRKRNLILKSYGLEEISNFRIIYHNEEGDKSLYDIYVNTMV